MICPACGKEYKGDFCPLCAAMKNEHTIADATGSQWFLAVCILVTIGSVLSANLLGVLACVFLWILYSEGSRGFFVGKHVRWLSGVVFAQRIILWALAGIVAIVGLFDNYPLWKKLQESDDLARYQEILGEITPEKILVVYLCTAAVLVAADLLLYRSIHRFVKSVYQSDEYFVKPPEKPGWAALCMAVLGVLNLVSVLGMGSAPAFLAIPATFCAAGAFLCGAWLVKVYFVKKKDETLRMPD